MMEMSGGLGNVLQHSLEEVISLIMEIPDEEFPAIKEAFSVVGEESMIDGSSVREAMASSDMTPEQYERNVAGGYEEYMGFVDTLPVSEEKKEFLASLMKDSMKEVLVILENGEFIQKLTVPVQLGEGAKLPERKTFTDACDDLYVTETVTIPPMGKGMVNTGLRMAIPKGYEGQVRLRSGISTKTPLMLANGVGTIDSDYKGDVKLALANLSTEGYTVEKGTRVAQIKLAPIYRVEWQPVEDIMDYGEDRGGGFASSGFKEMKRD